MNDPMRSSGSGQQHDRSGNRTLWAWGVRIATATGLLCAIVSFGVGGIVLGVIVLASASGVVAASMWGADGRRAVPRILRAGFGVGLTVPAAIGLIAVLGLAGAGVVLALVVTAPGLSEFLRTIRNPQDNPGARPEPSGPQKPPASLAIADEPLTELDALDDEALCLAWRRSYRRLEAARTPAERLVVVEQRQRYLDELDRRSPDGLAAWLAAGARASGNPLPYLDPRRRAG
ncbi:hypothetical protein [Kribbella sp. NPDC048915]|uniref:hypothetical protein n=1 Tax=Kribbella sp. NPDC048915 TaxID=3155148 RepID=UPI0034061666